MISRQSSLYNLAYLLMTGVCAVLLSVNARAAVDPERVITALKYARSDLVVVSAHRGIHYFPNCPENSTCAISQTVEKGIEAIEIDVKASKDGTLWVFHDSGVGRVTTYAHDGHYFDPYRPDFTAGSNPNVAALTDRQLLSLFLRDYAGSATDYRPLTLNRALLAIRDKWPHLAVQLDIKTAADAAKASAEVRNLGMGSYVIGKLAAKLVQNPADYEKIFRGMQFVPVVQASDLDNIVDKYSDKASQNCRHYNDALGRHVCTVQKYLYDTKTPLYIELGAKDNSPTDPAANFLGSLSLENRHRAPLGAFNPVPDAFGRPGYFFLSTGACCASSTTYLTKTKYFGIETRDNRGNLNFLSTWFGNIISDDPLGVSAHLSALGKRNVAFYR